MSKNNIIITIIVVVVIAIFVYFYLSGGLKTSNNSTTTAGETATTSTPESLGGEILKKTQNPLEGKIQTNNPAGNSNPLEGVYKNPFGG